MDLALILRGTDDGSTEAVIIVVALLVLAPVVMGLVWRAVDRRGGRRR